MKKVLSLTLALALLCTLLGGLSLGVHAADAEGSLGGLSWRVEGGVLTISGSGNMPEVTRYSSEAWVAYRDSIRSVVIEPGVTSVGKNAFYNFVGLNSVSIPDTVRSIGESAFCMCPALRKIELPEGLVSLDGDCFLDCPLTEIKLPSTLENIGSGCFHGCSALTEVELPASLKTMGTSVFNQCTSLQTARFGSGLTVLPGNAFATCGNLREVVLPDTLTEIEYGAFKECRSLEQLELPEGLEIIGRWAFERAEKLVNVELPASVRLIDYDAFCYVSNLRITIKNPDCVINYDPATAMYPLGNSPTVVGYDGSTAQDFAKKRNYSFVLLNGCAEGKHNFTGIKVLTPPTCETEGEQECTCVFCGETKREPIPTVDHIDVLAQVLQAPTYFEDGRGLYACTMCGRTREDVIRKLNPGYLYQEVLYNRDDWSGAYLLGGYTFQYYYDGSYDLDRLQLLGPGLTDGAKLELSQRFDVFSVRANTAKYTYIFEKVSENTYTIRSYWTGKYLAFSSMQLIMANAPIREALWNVYVRDGFFVISSINQPSYQLLYNEIEGTFQMLDTYKYDGTMYQAEEIFGIWLYEPDPCISFQDVDPRAWYHEGIDFAVAGNLFNGVSGNRFGVNSTMTRAMFVTVLWRMQGEPEAKNGKQFGDVPAGTWYTDAVAWASSEGIVNGTSETTFSPDTGITREQMAVLMYRYAQWLRLPVDETASLSAFPDASKVSNWAVEALGWATKAGIVTGTTSGGSVILKPQGSATRAQVATILMRFLLSYLQ